METWDGPARGGEREVAEVAALEDRAQVCSAGDLIAHVALTFALRPGDDKVRTVDSERPPIGAEIVAGSRDREGIPGLTCRRGRGVVDHDSFDTSEIFKP